MQVVDKLKKDLVIVKPKFHKQTIENDLDNNQFEMYLETSGEVKDDQISLESFHGNPGDYEAIYDNINTGDDLRFNKCSHIYLRTLVEDPTFDLQKHNSQKEVKEMLANLIQKHTGNHPEYSSIASISKQF